jgi:methylmalonyl-CoA mutase
VICSSDGMYAERAASTATALREAGAARVILAGAPGDLRQELEAAGVDEFWHVGIDVLDALTRLHADLGI